MWTCAVLKSWVQEVQNLYVCNYCKSHSEALVQNKRVDENACGDTDYKLSYIIIIYSNIYLFWGLCLWGLVMRYWALLPLIFCFKLVQLYKEKKTTTLLSSQFSLAALCGEVGYCLNWRGQNCKSRLGFTLVSSGSSFYHWPPPWCRPAPPFLRVNSPLSNKGPPTWTSISSLVSLFKIEYALSAIFLFCFLNNA